jgi:hypothetical protein
MNHKNHEEEKHKKGGKCMKYAMGGAAKVRQGQCTASGQQKMLKKSSGRNK